MMELKSATQDQEHALTLALAHLRRARALLVKANCTSSLKKLRSTIKSAEGAERHMSRRRSATKEAMLEEGRRAVAEEVAAATPDPSSALNAILAELASEERIQVAVRRAEQELAIFDFSLFTPLTPFSA